MTFKEALTIPKLSQPPPTGQKNCQKLNSVWQQGSMCTFKDFLRWCNNKDVPTLEAMQKMVDFYHNRGHDMLKLGCTSPDVANIFHHKSTNAMFYPFTESDKDLLEKLREDVGGPSIVVTRKAVVGETPIHDSTNWCKTIDVIDAINLYPYSMCQAMPTGL